MPVAPTYPGVYIQELPSGVHTISGVATSITAFVGYTARGLDNKAKRILSFADYQRAFGGLDSDSVLSYAVQQFFANGGGEAVVVRVPKSDATAASVTLKAASVTPQEEPEGGGEGEGEPGDEDEGEDAPAVVPAAGVLTLTALSRGAWANDVLVDVDYDGIATSDTKTFNLTVTDVATGAQERFARVTMDSASSRYVVAVVNDDANGSAMVSAEVPKGQIDRPAQTGTSGGDIDLTKLSNTQDYKIRISAGASGVPDAIDEVEVTVIATGEALPTSILGLGRLVERKINAALLGARAGARVKVVPSASGKGLRLLPDFVPSLLPDALDAPLKLAAGSPDALPHLKLEAAEAKVNVGHYRLGKGWEAHAQAGTVEGKDGTTLPGSADIIGSEAEFTGIYALEKVDLFNILCIPDATRPAAGLPNTTDKSINPNSIFSSALAYCTKRRALLIVDPPPEVRNVDKAADWISSGLTVSGANAAAYFPRIRVPDPLNDFQLRTMAPCGVVAGLYARTDASRGIWKAPAGTEARLIGVQGLEYRLTDGENGVLNPLGLNCFRSLPVYGTVSWGARTLLGADVRGSEWKYLPVRRLALMIEESLYRGTQWAVFEPNDERLWSQLRLNLTSFMHTLYRQGAFQGTSPREAYLVKCDAETTTQDDVNRGLVNVLVGFAPLRPAEFVIVSIQQLAGQGRN